MLQRLCLCFMAALGISGCLHTQLNGSVAGATVTVAPLSDPDNVVFSTVTDDEASNRAQYDNWDELNLTAQHWLYGVFRVEEGAVNETTLYLLTASGGTDYDINRDNLADAVPSPVAGEWHAVMTGRQLRELNFKVSPLTDAAWRSLELQADSINEEDVLQALDTLAARLVTDIDDSGSVDYEDLLTWSRLVNAQDTFTGDFEALNAYTDLLFDGADADTLLAAAIDLVGDGLDSDYDADYWRTVDEDLADERFATADFLYASTPDPDFCVDGDTSAAARQRALEAVNAVRALHDLAPVAYSEAYDAATQRGALIQRANNYLSHFPQTSDLCFREDGAAASESSNISASSNLEDPVSDVIGWVNDNTNVSLLEAAGHRRWIINPFLSYVSYSQVEGSSLLKVFDFDDEAPTTPEVDVDFVAFPFETYPYHFVSSDPAKPTPWSFSVVEDRTRSFGNQHNYFANASVEVNRASDGASLSVTSLYSDTDGFGIPNFLSWQVPDWEMDTSYQVTIRDVVMQTGEVRDFSYDVFIDYANLVDLTEPLEAGDSRNGNTLSGSLGDDDRDSYTLSLEGAVSFVGASQFSSQGFYILLYGPDEQLVTASDNGFSVTLDPGDYTVVISNCFEGSCYVSPGDTDYSVTID